MNKSRASLKGVITHFLEVARAIVAIPILDLNFLGKFDVDQKMLTIWRVNFYSLIKPYKYNVKRKHCPHGPIATITHDSQVKTYMDNSNGVRNINSHAYNKVPC